MDGSPLPPDWKRFERYSRRVRRLRYSYSTAQTSKRLHTSVFTELASTRLSMHILPNLHTLHWITYDNDELVLSKVFMHDRVKTFAVFIPVCASESFVINPPKQFFDEVIARMPALTHLDLRMQVPVRYVEDDVRSLLRSLPSLKEVVFPNYHITSGILTTLSAMPHIGLIQFEYGPDQGEGDSTDILSVAPSFSEGAFPALWDLSLTATLGDMTRFLSMPFAPAGLTSLYIDAPTLQTAREVEVFLVTMGETCPLLRALYLELLWLQHDEDAELWSEREDSVTWDTLRPLLNCPNLWYVISFCKSSQLTPNCSEFTLTHDHPLLLTPNNLSTLASSWPSLEVLLLACEPVNLYILPPDSPYALTLDALLPFAKHCKSLRTLGLFFDASSVHADWDTRALRFERLTKLNVGVSSITNPGAVALALSHVLPLGCEIECGVTWHMDLLATGPAREPIEEVGRRCAGWAEAKGMLPLLTKLRMEERRRAKAVEDEVEDLRVRNRILMERRGMVDKDGSCVIV